MDSVLEQIAKAVAARIELCPEVVKVSRPRAGSGLSPGHKAVTMVQAQAEQNAAMSHEGNPPVIAWQQPFQLYCTVDAPEGSDVDDDETINNFVAEVQKAISQPAESWHNWGGLAVNSMFGPMQPYIAEKGAYAGLLLTLFVIYRVDETDPFVSRA